MSDTYELFYRNESGAIDGQIATFNRLSLKMFFNSVGSWSLSAPIGILRELTWKGGLVVKRNGEVFFTGNVNKFFRKRDLTKNPIINSLECSGEDDNGYLLDRLALPVPSGPPYTAAEFDVRSGPFETVAKAYVNANIGPGAKSDRRVSGLTIETDSGRGGTVSGSARFETLDELLNALALQAGGIGYRVVGKQFQVYQVADKTGSVMLSEDLGSLSGFEYTLSRPKSNYLYLGGNGDGTARAIGEGLDSESVTTYGRIEEFAEQASLSTADEMAVKINELLARKTATFSLKLKPVALAKMRPIDDYWLGDRITAVIDGEVIQDVISAAEIAISRTDVTVTPVMGDLDGDEIAAMYADLRDVSGRVGSLERK